jgi:predicted DsbA family dithiol-disulfide isomerase
MRIDVISDVVCPWCFIGKRRLERALEARPAADVEVVWRPFQLNPEMPEEGRDHKAYYLEKFGNVERVRELTEAMTAAGRSEGIEFDFGNIPKAPNTISAHRLVRWAGSAGVQDAVVEALFRAYFLEARDVSDHQTLVAIGSTAGMEEELLKELYAEGRDIDLVRQEVKQAAAMGVSGVPCFIFEGGYVVRGAQPPEHFLPLIDTLSSRGQAAPASRVN